MIYALVGLANFIGALTMIDYSVLSQRMYSLPLGTLSGFRWFIPRAHREEIDLIIDDLKEDKSEMLRQKRSKKFIFLVLSWHVTRVISAYVWDGVTGLVKRVVPVAKFLSK